MGQVFEILNSPFTVKLATQPHELDQVFQLRYQVFVEETGNQALMNATHREHDEFDDQCDHLIVSDTASERIVGTYRLLPGTRTTHGGRFYSETLFDLTAFEPYKTRTLELGRSCVHPDFRDGRVISLLWEGISDYIVQHGYDFLIGPASMRRVAQQQINEIYSYLRKRQIITDKYGISPLAPNCIEDLQEFDIQFREREIFRTLPPLIKGYQRLGALIGGQPAYDPSFNTILFLIVLETHRITDRYKRNFLAR